MRPFASLKNTSLTATTLALTLLCASAGPLLAQEPQADGAAINVPDGTQLVLRLSHSLSSDSAKRGEPVLFEVAEALEVNGSTVIAQGAEGQGKVMEVRSRKGFGRRGLVTFSVESVQAVDGKPIPLRTSETYKGDERYTRAGVITLLFGPFGGLVKGKDVVIPAGTEYTIYTDRDWTVETSR